MAKIPNEVHYCYSKQSEFVIGARYESPYDKSKNFKKIIGFAAFPFFDLNKKTKAEDWARSNSKIYGYKDGLYKLIGEHDIKIYSRPNAPIKKLQLLYLAKRGQGGRAYKVAHMAEDGNNYIFDLREDALIDSLFNNGCQNGVFLSEFFWGKKGSQTKLIHAGSE